MDQRAGGGGRMAAQGHVREESRRGVAAAASGCLSPTPTLQGLPYSEPVLLRT